MFSVVGRGCVILECREDVRLGMTRFSAWSRVGGRSPVRGRRLSEGAMLLMRIEGSSELGQTAGQGYNISVEATNKEKVSDAREG